MLRKPPSSSSFLRHFSTSRTIWNLQAPKSNSDRNLENQSSPLVTYNSDAKSEDTQIHPTFSETKSFGNLQQSNTQLHTANQLDLVKKRLRSWTEQAAIVLRVKADDFTASTKTTFSQLGSELNRVTGYDEIEILKRGIVEQEERINVTREAAKKAKQAFESAVTQRASSQREVNDLLSRKSMWADSDVGRFTTLVRQDHLYEQEEACAKATVEEKEASVDREFSQLLRAILARYHEEQVWSDKIRSASTYGSLAALGLNMLVFIMAIVVVEPWKRRRLAQTFERKLEELSSENEGRLQANMQSISQQISQQVHLLDEIKQGSTTRTEVLSTQVAIPQIHESVANFKLLSWQLSQHQLEVVVMGVSAFAIGVLSSLVAGR